MNGTHELCTAQELKKNISIQDALTNFNDDKLKHLQAATLCQNQNNDCAPSEDSDLPGHLPNLIKSLMCAQRVVKDLSFLHAESEDSD